MHLSAHSLTWPNFTQFLKPLSLLVSRSIASTASLESGCKVTSCVHVRIKRDTWCRLSVQVLGTLRNFHPPAPQTPPPPLLHFSCGVAKKTPWNLRICN